MVTPGLMPFLRLISTFYTFLYRQLYTRFAWAYDGVSWLVSLGHWGVWRRTALDFVVGGDVLEIGFGTGELLSAMARQGINAIGLEASAAMHRITARKLAGRGLAVARVQGFAQQLPFADASIDTIFATFPAGFVTDLVAHREFARVLRPGGRLVFVDVVLSTDNPLFRLFFGLAFPPSPRAAARFQQALTTSELHFSKRIVGQGAVRVVVTLGEKAAADEPAG